jgi:hypothetical protein
MRDVTGMNRNAVLQHCLRRAQSQGRFGITAPAIAATSGIPDRAQDRRPTWLIGAACGWRAAGPGRAGRSLLGRRLPAGDGDALRFALTVEPRARHLEPGALWSQPRGLTTNCKPVGATISEGTLVTSPLCRSNNSLGGKDALDRFDLLFVERSTRLVGHCRRPK